eukprot:g6669.t1
MSNVLPPCAAPRAHVEGWLSQPATYERALEALAMNARMGPFVATSGLQLPYLVSAMTSLLDADTAPHIATALADTIMRGVVPRLPPARPGRIGDRLLCVGMETAGGVLAAQIAAVARASAPALLERATFGYLRKTRKKSGTRQLLEGPAAALLDSAGNASEAGGQEAAQAVWVDDVMSTGGSLVEGARALWEEHRVRVVAAVFVLDRAADRLQRATAADAAIARELAGVHIVALYDLAALEAKIETLRADELRRIRRPRL